MHSVCPATTALPAAPSDQGALSPGLTPRGAAFTIEALLGLGPASPDSSTPAGPVSDRGCSPCHERRRGADSARRHGEPRARRVRTIFTADQLERLEAEFERQQYMVGPERLYLAAALRLTEAQVKVWFQNRRIKWRKQHLDMQRLAHAAAKLSPQTPPQTLL